MAFWDFWQSWILNFSETGRIANQAGWKSDQTTGRLQQPKRILNRDLQQTERWLKTSTKSLESTTRYWFNEEDWPTSKTTITG